MPNADYEYSITNGEVTLTRYLGKDKCVKIPAEIDGYPVTLLKSTFANHYGIKKVIVPKSIRSMILAFDYCRGLEKVKLSRGLISIDFWCFRECRSLKKLVLPNTVKSVTRASFENSGIEKLRIPNKIEYIDELPPLVKGFKKPLIRCRNLLFVPKNTVEYTIPQGVERIGVGAFIDCKKLEKVTLPNTVKEICYEAFRGCSSLKYINLPDSLVKIDMGVFSDCTALEEIILPDSLQEINSFTFNRCTALKKVKLPQNLDTIYSAAFSNCAVLEDIVIPAGTKIEPMAFNMTPLDDDYRNQQD